MKERKEELKALIADELTGGLDAAGAERLRAELAADPAARAELEELRALWAALGSLEDEAPSPAAGERFERMLAAYQEGRAAGAFAWRRRLRALADRLRPGRASLGLAFASLLAGLLIGSRLLPSGPTAEVEGLRGEVASLSQTVSLTLLERGVSAGDRLEAVSLARRSLTRPGPTVDDRLLAALVRVVESDPNDNVRLAAIDALARFADRPQVIEGLSRSLERQSSPLVVIELADLLLAGDGVRARSAVSRLLEDPDLDPSVRRHLRERLGQSA